MSIQKIIDIDEIETTEEQWWMLYDETRRVSLGPCCEAALIYSPLILIIADTEEELLTYIEENGLTIDDEDKL